MLENKKGKQVRDTGNEQGRTELLVDFMVQWFSWKGKGLQNV